MQVFRVWFIMPAASQQKMWYVAFLLLLSATGRSFKRIHHFQCSDQGLSPYRYYELMILTSITITSPLIFFKYIII